MHKRLSCQRSTGPIAEQQLLFEGALMVQAFGHCTCGAGCGGAQPMSAKADAPLDLIPCLCARMHNIVSPKQSRLILVMAVMVMAVKAGGTDVHTASLDCSIELWCLFY